MKKSKMWSGFIFFVIIIIIEAEARFPDNDPMKIIFKIQTEPNNTLICDHSDDKKQQNIYTVLEGEPFTIVTKYEHLINHFICHDAYNENNGFHYKNINMKNETTFVGEKRMGTLWKCTIWTHRDNPIKKPVVHYKGADYTAAYCFMKIHVRKIEPPQMMLVNNNKIPAARRDLSEKDVDFIAEYQYVDGDVVNVTCANTWTGELLEPTLLTMEYEMAGTTSDESTMKDISSNKMIGFVTKLHTGHNNSYMICTNTETTDYTKVMMRFVMKTKRNIVSITINGMIQRPILKNIIKNHYVIDYKFAVNESINVTCEVKQTDVKLVLVNDDIAQSKDYKKTELISNKKTETRFHLNAGDNKTLHCLADYVHGAAAESVYIHFTAATFPIDYHPSVHMELPSSGTVMELYSYGDYKLTVILYEFKHDETLQLTCGPLVYGKTPGPVIYLQLNNIEICRVDGCSISKTLHVTRGHMYPPIVCYLKEEHSPELPPTTMDTVFKEIRVILRERALTTESSTTEPASNTIIPARTADIFTNETAADPSSSSKTQSDAKISAVQDSKNSFSPILLGSSIGAVLLVLAVIGAVYCFVRIRNAKHIETPYVDVSNQTDNQMPQHTNESENQYDLCHNSDRLSKRETCYSTPESVENVDPKDHYYTEIVYFDCKVKIDETQNRNSRVYDEPYVQININNKMQT